MAFLALVLLLLLVAFPVQFEAQQSYVNNKQLKCNESPNNTLGFVCNAAPSCTSYLTFRSTPTYNSPATIAYLLAADASQIATANNISDVAPLPTDTLVLVPVNCSCSGNAYYYQHNASYTLKTPGETYFTVANDTYQSLSTCQSLIAQNPYNLRQLLPNMRLLVPLRCACPTPSQTAAGFNYLLTYLLRQGNDVNFIAAQFAAAGADVQAILHANMLNTSIVFFFTPLLVPLKIQPTKENINTAPSPPPPPPPSVLPNPTTPSASHKWVFIGVGIGAAVLVILSSIALVWLFRRRKPHPHPPPAKGEESPPPPPLSELSQGIRSATMESLSLYKLEELNKATDSFAESKRIAGSSVYHGWFNGDEAVVKVMKGDVSGEINTLRQINHSRIIRLSGYCVHEGTTYLVYEYAQNGSLKEWVWRLDWKQRVQVAYDVADALNYLHHFTNPPYIHKNLTTANILLDASMRPKLANFGLARALDSDNITTTRHVVGEQGYMAPEYIETGLLTPKLDVFAFGVVMLELLSGTGKDHKWHGDDDLSVREKLQGFMDPNLDYPLDLAYSMAQLATSCVAHNLDARPTMSDVFVRLSALRSSSLDWDPSLDTSFGD
ncbi:protein LYK5 [Salvia miltiorrhiza]|uniref:protein LYK5 n=1 Tax=Salvia miltiorrhiza TaxID=226208 RepID=UPI0025ACD056|nr:protein LYK5 [Salvia miltiorrhiza]